MTKAKLLSISLLFLAGAFPALSVFPADAANILQNPLFEEIAPGGAPAGWSLPGAAGLDERSLSGSRCVILKLSGDDRSAIITQSVGDIAPGTYVLSFYTMIIGEAEVNSMWGFYDHDNRRLEKDGERIQGGTERVRTAPSWTRVEGMIEVPGGTWRMNLWTRGMLRRGVNEEALVFFDDFSLVPLEALEKGKLVYEQDFSAGDIPPGWEIVSGEWSVEDGALRGSGDGIIFYTGKTGSPNMRIEYTAWADENPCDLSALAAVERPAGFRELEGYFFGFGGELNTVNKIVSMTEARRDVLAEQGGLLEVFEDGIQAGVKHDIAVQRVHDELKLFVDGNLVLEAHDPFFGGKTGERFGFYIWSEGFIDEVRVYSLPWAGADLREREIEFEFFEDFEEYLEGEYPLNGGGFSIGRGSPGLRITDMPTWVYRDEVPGTEFVRDHCLEIMPGALESKISRALPRLDSGIVEFDVMAKEHGELKFAVSGEDGKDIINLIITEDGTFMTEDEKGRRVIRDSIMHTRRRFAADFKFMKNRWYTLRLHFGGGENRLTMLDLYSIVDSHPLKIDGEYLPLDFAPAQGGDAVSFSVSAAAGSFVYLDNLVIYGPVGGGSVRGKPLTKNSADILGLPRPPRKDPFQLKLQTYRNVWAKNNRQSPLFRAGGNAEKYSCFREAGEVYNGALVQLAFMEERLNMLRRSALYAGEPGLKDRLEREAAALEALMGEAEALQEDALRAYAEAHLDGQNRDKLDAFYEKSEKAGDVREKIREGIESCLDMLEAFVRPGEPVMCPLPHPEGRIVWNSARKRWERGGEPVVYSYFSHAPVWTWERHREWMKSDVRMLGFPHYRCRGAGFVTFPRRHDAPPLEEGRFIEGEDGRTIRWLKSIAEDGGTGHMNIMAAGHYPSMFAPEWWLERHGVDGEIIFAGPAGEPLEDPVGARGSYLLNYWHPEVKNLVRKQFSAVGALAEEYKDVITHFRSAGEVRNIIPGGLPGYNENAVSEFRAGLEQKYGSVENLNRLWGSSYESFDGIGPHPPDGGGPSGLRYEFMKFVADGFSEWLRSVGDALQYYSTDIPTANDEQNTLGFRTTDPIGFIRAADIKLYHTYQGWDRKIVDRWHHQVAEKALGTPWGTFEWIISQGCPYMSRLEPIRNNGLREKAMQWMWGATMLDTYSFGYGGWQYTTRIHNPALDYYVFNYTAPFYALNADRQMRLGEPALTAPTVKPRVGLIETTASHYNGFRVREGMRKIAVELAEAGWDFEFLYEQLLDEGLQALEGIEVLFVPAGLSMTCELAEAVYGWVRGGGIMIASGGPPGYLTEYGLRSGRLKGIFEGEWNESGGRWELEGMEPFYASEEAKAWKVEHGDGVAAVYDNITGNMFKLMEENTVKAFGSDNPKVQLCMREKDGVKYLYALNWSVYDTAEAEVFVEGNYGSVVDEGLQLAMDVPRRGVNGRTYFRTRLAPAEITLFRLRRDEH